MKDELWSDDNEYPTNCPECSSGITIETPDFAQYECFSFVSGYTGRHLPGKDCSVKRQPRKDRQ